MTSFAKFGKHGYVSQSKVSPIVDYLEKGELMGTKCDECRTVYFPPRADCPKCQSNKVSWVKINDACKLITFTEVYFGPPAFERETPYLLGLAQLQEGQRVFAPISPDLARNNLKPGLRLVLRPTHDGNGVYYRLEKPGNLT